MLQDYVAPYNATCYERLVHHGGTMIAKANLDQFAMGASGETSFFGPATNPRDTTKVP